MQLHMMHFQSDSSVFMNEALPAMKWVGKRLRHTLTINPAPQSTTPSKGNLHLPASPRGAKSLDLTYSTSTLKTSSREMGCSPNTYFCSQWGLCPQDPQDFSREIIPCKPESTCCGDSPRAQYRRSWHTPPPPSLSLEDDYLLPKGEASNLVGTTRWP